MFLTMLSGYDPHREERACTMLPPAPLPDYPLPFCLHCRLERVAKAQNLTCSVECARRYRAKLTERRTRRLMGRDGVQG